MNIVDVILILIILLSTWSGYQKGFVIGTLNMVTWLGSLLVGFFFYTQVAQFIDTSIRSFGVWTRPLAFIITVLLARMLLSIITGQVMNLTTEQTHRDGINKFLGIFPGFLNGLLNAVIIAALLMALPLFEGLSQKTRESKLANFFVGPAEWLESKIDPVFGDAVQRSLNRLMVRPQSDETVKLHYTVNDAKVREDLEARMLQMVNEERAKEGLAPLQADPEMANVARKHSADMFARGYFAHINPDGEDPFDRMRKEGVRFVTAGENLALAQTLIMAHNGLMNSPGHRANILHKSFGRLGIGVLDGGIYGLMITQNFRN